ncbi:MAG: hypothetical protein IJD99_00045 [Clostridia bacterium]|nr:hypothetical protein [Clostridia bacterium]
MKKMLSFLLAMLMVLGAVPAMADVPGREPMPDEIAALFDVPAWEGYEVMTGSNGLAWIYDESLEAGLVVMTNGSLEIVCLIEPDKKGNLRITQRNYTMITQECGVMLESGYGTTTQEVRAPWGEQWMFEVFNVNDAYYLAIGKFDGEWRVKTVLNYKTDVLSFVAGYRIGYSDPVEHEDYIEFGRDMEYVYGTYDNRFAAFNIYDFPKTLEEAREKLTNPPVTPSDFYSPVSVDLRPKEKYDVFAAPGRDSYRAANGKAVMSTNDWVQIFGEEDGWVLVQYDISRDQMRFGYVDASVLPRDTEVPQLRWYDLPTQTIKTNTYVTDDPLASRSILCWLNAGDTVQVLSDFGSWYYVEVTPGTGKTLRGFIPQTAIDLADWNDTGK